MKWVRNIAVYLPLLVIWEFVVRVRLVSAQILPAPSDVLKAIYALAASGELFRDAALSLFRVSAGFAFAAMLGMVLGVVTAEVRFARTILTPLVEILRPVPPAAYVGIAVMWWGLGNGPSIFLVTYGSFFPIYTLTALGIMSVNPLHRDASRCLGASHWLMLTDIVIPTALPQILAGLKTGLGVAWFCVIVAELIAQGGLGYLIQLNRLMLRTDNVVAGIVVVGIMGYSMQLGMDLLTRRLVRWHQPQRQ